ncbi:MAG: hypothetical protein MUF21_12545, partial [Gemmatimonadaceae bacterium]|nr:hypothetical protein [Gemmatimonadaceae bacterium]
VYGGHVLSLARHLSFNGLANALGPVAIHGGRHVAPSFAGDTIHCWSEILATDPLPGRTERTIRRSCSTSTIRWRWCGADRCARIAEVQRRGTAGNHGTTTGNDGSS